MLPFTREQFPAVFVAYNEAVWPVQETLVPADAIERRSLSSEGAGSPFGTRSGQCVTTHGLATGLGAD